MSDMVAIASGLPVLEAHMLRAVLETEGIYAAVLEGDFEGAPVVVLVREEDVRQAREIRQRIEDQVPEADAE